MGFNAMRVVVLGSVLGGCTSSQKDSGDPAGSNGVPALGDGTLSSVSLTVVASDADGLNVPRDLEFNPDVEGELWVVNRADDSVTMLFDAGTESQTSEHRIDPFALHFMEEVSSIAFGGVTFDQSDARTFGTCQESRNTYNDRSAPNDFMGPALWTADLDLFAVSNPEAVEYLSELYGYRVDLGSHLDMLHESPLCMGIAWETENVYWVFDGMDGTIVRYDFQEDHETGFDDHSDGLIYRYVDATVSRVEDVPSHMVLDPDSQLLYTVDTGNNRITVLDITSGTEGASLRAIERGTVHVEYDDAVYSTLIEGSEIDGMERPSGIALVEGTLLITDNQTSTVFAFDLDGNLLQQLDLEREDGALMGIEARSLSDIWLVDAITNEVLRLQP